MIAPLVAVIVSCSGMLYCSSLFWRPAAPLHTAMWAGTAHARAPLFWDIESRWEEKGASPFAVASGTTVKRGYTSTVRLLRVQSQRVEELTTLFTFAGWIAPETLFRTPPTSNMPGLWFVGGQNDVPGGPGRSVFYLSAETSTQPGTTVPRAILSLNRPGFTIERAVPDPGGEYLMLLYTQPTGAGDAADRVRFVSLAQLQTGTPGHTPEFVARAVVREGPRWTQSDRASNPPGIYLRDDTGTVFISAAQAQISRVATGPACLQPWTDSGGAVAPGGIRLYFDDAAGVYQIQNEAPELAFEATAYVDYEQTGQACP